MYSPTSSPTAVGKPHPRDGRAASWGGRRASSIMRAREASGTQRAQDHTRTRTHADANKPYFRVCRAPSQQQQGTRPCKHGRACIAARGAIPLHTPTACSSGGPRWNQKQLHASRIGRSIQVHPLQSIAGSGSSGPHMWLIACGRDWTCVRWMSLGVRACVFLFSAVLRRIRIIIILSVS